MNNEEAEDANKNDSEVEQVHEIPRDSTKKLVEDSFEKQKATNNKESGNKVKG